MVRSLKQIVIPALQTKGFSGSFPHYRRPSGHQLDLLSFQFDRYGGGFVVEISYCPPQGIVTPWGKRVEPKDIDVAYIHPGKRLRLGSQPGNPDYWFRYDVGPCRPDVYERLAKQVLGLIDAQAEPWWSSRVPDPAVE